MRRLKKYASGEGASFITRRQALCKLQLSLNDFSRLCILKGIYPREPKHRRRAQRGSTDIQILYHTKDIEFLLHEAIVRSLRDHKIFQREADRDRALKDFRALNRRLRANPEIKWNHIVSDLYRPTLIDAVKDLDDCLTLLSLFSTFPSLKYVPSKQSTLCRRLTSEFLHAVITSKSLRQCFISIKGYYFQAEIKGQKVTWLVPHKYPFQPQSRSEADFRMMSIFVKFYTFMLEFVNSRLYNQLNLVYPPQFPSNLFQNTEQSLNDEQVYVSERIASLIFDLMRIDPSAEELEADDDIHIDLIEGENESDQMKRLKEKAAEKRKLKNMFKDLKIFINREVPREPLVFWIRCLGGKVSWDKTSFVGATFDETDETITHHIIDRPSISNKYISRDYVQPQWVFDCVNKRQLLPVDKYLMVAKLPPHLSPFVDPNREEVYIPPEEKALRDQWAIETHEPSESETEDDIEDVPEPERDDQLENAYRQEQQDASWDVEDMESDGDNAAYKDDDDTEQQKDPKQKMSVQTGKVHRENKRAIKKQEIEEHRLKARMVKPKQRHLFTKLIREQQGKQKENWLLEKKRKRIDAAAKEERQQKKIAEKKKTLDEDVPDAPPNDQNPMQGGRPPLQDQIDGLHLVIDAMAIRIRALENAGRLCRCGAMDEVLLQAVRIQVPPVGNLHGNIA